MQLFIHQIVLQLYLDTILLFLPSINFSCNTSKILGVQSLYPALTFFNLYDPPCFTHYLQEVLILAHVIEEAERLSLLLILTI